MNAKISPRNEVVSPVFNLLRTRFLVGLALVLAGLILGGAAGFAAAESGGERDARLAWWRQARFGMFIHWGPVSLKGTEIGWSRGDQVPVDEYDRLYQRFNPTNFNADAWARLAKDTGMKYLILTTKHHDGFCLWDTAFTDYNIMNTPFHRDVVKELAAACKRQGLVFGTYHSILDWRHPDYPLGSPGGKAQKPQPNMDRYYEYLRNQVAELIQQYGPLGVLWFDGEWESPWNHERAKDLNACLRLLQPSLIINNRIDKGRQDMAGTTQAGDFLGDYDTPEQQIGAFQKDRPWESCITLCQQWAWKPNDPMKSVQECLRTLIACAGGDGNLLLNVGPMPDGRIEPRQEARLREVGQWMQQFGQTVYGTRGGPYKPGPWGASTCRGNRIYLHIFAWPGETLRLPAIPCIVVGSRSWTGGRARIVQIGNELRVTVPPANRHAIDTLVELRIDGRAADLAPVETAGPRNP